MQHLPIDDALPRILDLMRTTNAAILIASPGAGKTTRIPPALAQHLDLPGAILMLQPRRVAARASAQRIADENNWTLGQEVGYHIRFEKRYTPKTKIRILTEAILTRILLDDPYLEGMGGVSCVILDEFHERNIHTDLTLAFLREIQQTVRPDLKLLIMSATLNPQPLAQFLNNAPILEVEGRTFPIHIHYRPPKDARLEDHLPRVIEEALDHEGDILIFLPGRGEIERTTRSIENRKAKIENVVLPLHGSLTPEDQQKALRPDPSGRRKIILATNIAETSLTIDGVRTVIDTGLARIASFDPDRGMDRLDLERISQGLRRPTPPGRAGRRAPGQCLRLWPEQEQKHLPLQHPRNPPHRPPPPPSSPSTPGAQKSAKEFPFFEPPTEDRPHRRRKPPRSPQRPAKRNPHRHSAATCSASPPTQESPASSSPQKVPRSKPKPSTSPQSSPTTRAPPATSSNAPNASPHISPEIATNSPAS